MRRGNAYRSPSRRQPHFAPILSCSAFAKPREEKGAHWRVLEEDRGALVDAHVAALEAGLKLTPMQEKIGRHLKPPIREHAKAGRRASPNGVKSQGARGTSHAIEGIAISRQSAGSLKRRNWQNFAPHRLDKAKSHGGLSDSAPKRDRRPPSPLWENLLWTNG